MNIENARYRSNQGYPLLDVVLDGKAYAISPEQKPTLVRHGLVSIPGVPFSADLQGQALAGVTGDPYPFRLVTALWA